MGRKLCRNCNIEKPLEEFAKANNKRDGRQAYCKPCTKRKYPQRKYKKKVKIHDTITGYKKPKYEREELLKQMGELRQRESNPQTMTGYDFSFLWTNEKFLE